MRQTFYINSDEEIISVVGKIKNSPSMENILVIPPGALVLQSIINLKLLKKESEKLGKQVMIVVQDKQSRRLVEKAGILAQSSLEESEKEGLEERESNQAAMNKNIRKKMDKRERLANIGSKDFFGSQTSVDAKTKTELSAEAKLSGPRANISDILSAKRKTAFSKMPRQKTKAEERNRFNLRKEKEIEKLFGGENKQFSANSASNQTSRGELKDKPTDSLVSGRIKKMAAAFLAACFLTILTLGFFLVFPKAKVNVFLKADIKEDDLVVEGNKNVSFVSLEKKSIPAAIVKKEDSLSLSFSATGKSAASNRKARGVITIYNEYGKSPQALVATTRFLTSDGKLFRLIKGVIIPGMTKVNGKMEPGAVEAEVMADKSGEEYNIGPGDFSIPGFKGSPKYGKFYARSSRPMVGGGSIESEITVVSQKDISSAKSKTESALKDKIKEEIKKEIGEDKIILDGAISENVLESNSSVEEGVAVKDFSYQAKMEITAVIFSREDLEKVVEEIFKKKLEEEGVKMKISKVEIEYGQPDANFESGKIAVKVSAKAVLEPKINLDNLKKELLGKNDAQIKEVLKNYPQVDKIEIEYWPKFFSQEIPRFGKRVEIKAIVEK